MTTTATGGVDSTLDAGAIQLVDYTGEQPAGYSVDEVPEGWVLLGADEDALTIGPAGVPDTDPNSSAGKLAVLLMSKDATLPTEGTPVTVGSVEGTVVDNSGEVRRDGSPAPFSSTLCSVDPVSAQPVSVQVPAELNWTSEEVAAFARGVHVTDAAVRGVG